MSANDPKRTLVRPALVLGPISVNHKVRVSERQLGRTVMQKKQALERDRRQALRGVLEHRSFDASKALLHDCDQRTVKDSILAFRRGPIRHRHHAMIACEGDPTDYMYVVVSGVVRSCRAHRDGTRGIVAFTCPESFLDGAVDSYIHSRWKPQQIHSCFFSNAALCLPPPFETAKLQRICWPLQRMSFDASKTIHFC